MDIHFGFAPINRALCKPCLNAGCSEGEGGDVRIPTAPATSRLFPPWSDWENGYLVVKGTGYGLDVLCFIGRAYFVEAVSLPLIHQQLCDTYGLQISLRHVSNLFKIFLSLVEGRNLDKDSVLEQLRKQGGIILSADAVVFDETSPALFVVRDVPSGEILYAERMDAAAGNRTEIYVRVLRKVQSCGVPVNGIVTDKEVGLVAAVREVFPDTPHQFCQTHYLQNLRRSIEPELSEMGQAVREVVKAAQKAERDFMSSPNGEERQLALGLCRVVITQGKVRGDNLTDPAAYKRYCRQEKALQTLEKACERPGSWPLLNRLRALLSPIDRQRSLAELIEREVEVVRQTAAGT